MVKVMDIGLRELRKMMSFWRTTGGHVGNGRPGTESYPTGAKKILILQCRGLGDAIIGISLINAIRESWGSVVVDIWATEDVAPLFRDHPLVDRCYVQSIPVLRRQRWTISSPLHFIKQVRRLRANEYDCCLNVVGDFRENFLTSLVGAKRTWSVVWEKGHWFNRLIYPGLSWLIRENEVIPKTYHNIYDVYRYVADRVGYTSTQDSNWRGGTSVGERRRRDSQARCVGIHPLASQKCKEWPYDRWNEFVRKMLGEGYKVIVFGAPSERDKLDAAFEEWAGEPRVSIMTQNLSAFFEAVRTVSAFVGLDSFGVHAAHAVQVPSIMINSGNDPLAWSPPDTRVLGNGGGCEYFPCYNKPRCVGTATEYACVKTISVDEVFAALRDTLRNEQRSSNANQEDRSGAVWR